MQTDLQQSLFTVQFLFETAESFFRHFAFFHPNLSHKLNSPFRTRRSAMEKAGAQPAHNPDRFGGQQDEADQYADESNTYQDCRVKKH